MQITAPESIFNLISLVFAHKAMIYKYAVEFGGAGATVPLTGFGYLLAKGVEKAVAEQGILGALTGGVTAAAGGITAAIFFGYLMALIFKPKPKK